MTMGVWKTVEAYSTFPTIPSIAGVSPKHKSMVITSHKTHYRSNVAPHSSNSVIAIIHLWQEVSSFWFYSFSLRGGLKGLDGFVSCGIVSHDRGFWCLNVVFT